MSKVAGKNPKKKRYMKPVSGGKSGVKKKSNPGTY